MAVRVRLRIARGEKVLDIIALINSGYEADSPQLMIPLHTAKELELWPPPLESREEVFETAGGPIRVWVVRQAGTVKALGDDEESRQVQLDIVISPLADEPLISDVLAGALEIAVEDFAEGLWRFRWEPKEKLKKSLKRGY
ncbi:MAG: hypothetical protein LZ171_02515, partial [Thaumarchaeota archaeon]|nr:hypothetical protein [Candidatus Geocrenenecus arthurdayi]